MSKKFVVIGASAASLAFISKLRATDKDSEIVCLSGESDIPYNRCLLADFVSKDKSLEQIMLKPKDFFAQNNIDLRLNSWVTRIDASSNRVFVKDEAISYDYLFLGTGARPHIPNVGVDRSTKGIFTFHTLDDVKQISAYIQKYKPVNVVVVGAGINGVECVSALHARKVAVGLIERCNQVMPLQLDQEVASYVQSILQHKGVGLFLNSSIKKVCVDNGKVRSVQLESGTSIATDCVVFATGSVVNAELPASAGLKVEQGSVVVDSSMKTSIDNIYAGGDLCLVSDAVSKELVRSATWADAMLQGLCAATQFSSRPRLYPGAVGLRDSFFFDYPFYGCGKTIGHDESYQVHTKTGTNFITKVYTKEGVVKGFVLLGDSAKVAEYKKLYLTKGQVKNDFKT